MTFPVRLLCLFPLLLGAVSLDATAVAQAQDTTRTWQAHVETRLTATTGDAVPFDLYANRFATVDSTSANGALFTGLRRRITLSDDWTIGGGVEMLSRASNHSTIHAHQIYGRIGYRGLRLQGGRWEETPLGLVDPDLSMGSMIRSPNAAPIPKVTIWSPEYLSVPGTRDYLAVKGLLSHGWLSDRRFVSGAFYHEKSFSLRILPNDVPVQFYAGGIQGTVWGGTHPTLGEQPGDVAAFLRVLGGQPGGSDAEQTDQRGTLGMTEAAYDFGMVVRYGTYRLRVTRYFHHTDRPSLFFRNLWDGVTSVRVRQTKDDALVQTLLWEHLNSTRQNAKYSEGETRGEDTYYNNSLYHGGWTYLGRTIGNPLLLPNRRGPGVGNNIVLAHRVGLQGQVATVRYRTFVTYSRHYGAQSVCANAECSRITDPVTDRTERTAFFLDLRRSVGAFTVRAEAAVDAGALFGDRTGVTLGLRWDGDIGTIR